jgi:hypothetical protein
MSRFWVLGPGQTKTGRAAYIENDRRLVVASDCCAAPYRSDGLTLKCSVCAAEVANNGMWLSEIDIKTQARHQKSGYNDPDSWDDWLKFWFGLEEGSIKFNE